MKNTRVYALIMVLVTMSFVGFLVENIFISFSLGFMDNRNMNLPFLWGYGIGIFFLYLLFGTPDEPKLFGTKKTFKSKAISYIYYFAVAFIAVSVAEIALGYFIEWTCDIIWWEYTTLPLHFTRYTSVPTSAAFAILILLFMKLLFNRLIDLFSKIPQKPLTIIAMTFAVLLSADMLNSFLYMIINNNTLSVWRIEFEQPFFNVILELFS